MPRPIRWRQDFSAPWQALQTELGRLLEDYWNPIRVGAMSSTPTDLEPTGWSPVVDVVETGDEIVVLAEVPGVDPNSIDLSVTGNVLSLRGMKVADEPKDSHATIRERRFGAFHRQIALPNEVNFETAQAEAGNGVLRVRLPKQQAARTRTIPVQHV